MNAPNEPWFELAFIVRDLSIILRQRAWSLGRSGQSRRNVVREGGYHLSVRVVVSRDGVEAFETCHRPGKGTARNVWDLTSIDPPAPRAILSLAVPCLEDIARQIETGPEERRRETDRATAAGTELVARLKNRP